MFLHYYLFYIRGAWHCGCGRSGCGAVCFIKVRFWHMVFGHMCVSK